MMSTRIEPDVARTAETLERIGAAYRYEPTEHVPALVGDVSYRMRAEDPAPTPADSRHDGGSRR